jgi:hypothetical protein
VASGGAAVLVFGGGVTLPAEMTFEYSGFNEVERKCSNIMALKGCERVEREHLIDLSPPPKYKGAWSRKVEGANGDRFRQ